MNEKLKSRTARLLSPDEPCAVDEPLKAAIDAGIIHGDLQQHRERLAVTMAGAVGTKVLADGQRAAIETLKVRRELARKTTKTLDALVNDLTDEAEALAALLEATEVDDADTEATIKERRRQAAMFAKAAEEARSIASEPVPALTQGNRTNWLLRGFFEALSDWWNEHQKPTNMDALKARDEIAEALALDLGLIPDGYAIGAFARYGFRRIK